MVVGALACTVCLLWSYNTLVRHRRLDARSVVQSRDDGMAVNDVRDEVVDDAVILQKSLAQDGLKGDESMPPAQEADHRVSESNV